MGQREWASWTERARAAPVLEIAEKLGASKLKRSGAAEWAGPCPACGGVDRFAVNTQKRVFNCRGSGDGGDVIDMVKHVMLISFVEAMEFITGENRPDQTRDETDQERSERQRRNAERSAQLRARQELEDEEAAKRARKDEEYVDRIIDRAIAIEGTHAEAYMRKRGLTPPKRLTGDLRFVEGLDYWGLPDNGRRESVRLAEVPALVAIIRNFAGEVIGISQTYLDPREPKKWAPTGSPRNGNKKIRGKKEHGMIRLGRIGKCLAISEGWENALAWHQMGNGPEDVTLAAAVDLGNLAGGATGSTPHKFLKDGDGRPVRIANGVPNMQAPGVILPEGVESIILLGDADSDFCTTVAKMRTGTNRFVAEGHHVDVSWPPMGLDFNKALLHSLPLDVQTSGSKVLAWPGA